MFDLIKGFNGDKYSPRIKTFLKKNKHIDKVYLVMWDWVSGLNSKKGTLYFTSSIYDDDLFSGVEVNRVMCGKYQIYAYTGFSGVPFCNVDHKDVTDWFIKNYKDKGKCLFDDCNHDFIKINSHSRKCKHCGKVEFREVKTVIKRERKEIWA